MKRKGTWVLLTLTGSSKERGEVDSSAGANVDQLVIRDQVSALWILDKNKAFLGVFRNCHQLKLAKS